MIGVLNYKPFERGSLPGFFDFRYHGLVVTGCRLMIGQNVYWMSFPQKEGTDKDGKIQYFDQMYLTKLEIDHLPRLVVAESEAKDHIEHRKAGDRKTQNRVKKILQSSGRSPHPRTRISATTCRRMMITLSFIERLDDLEEIQDELDNNRIERMENDIDWLSRMVFELLRRGR